MAFLKRKIGYGFGDMASSMFWKIFSYYLPFFYSNIFGLSLLDAGILVMVTRIWDAVSDPMMGVLADRTDTRMGKYRPYLLWFCIPFAVCGILLFTTPDFSYAGKLIWAYVTYVLMMTVYTGINVPYGAMLGVITDKSDEKTVYSSYRMFFAYGGSFIALATWEPMCGFFEKTVGLSAATSWQSAMCVIAAACIILFLLCFAMTREVVRTKSVVSIGNDFKALLKNRPWWLLICAALSFNLFNTVRGATVAYFFADVIGADANMWLFGLSVLFYSGLFLSIGEVANMVGVALTVPIASALGKKPTFIMVNALLIVFSIGFFFLPLSSVGFFLMLLFQIGISVLTGIMSPLVWSMYADVADYSEHRFHTASTGLIFSSSSMAQKFGGAIGGAAVLWLLSACGYVAGTGATEVVQPESAINCLWALMTFIPAGVAALAICVVWFYPLTTEKVNEIAESLRVRRSRATEEAADIAENFDNINN